MPHAARWTSTAGGVVVVGCNFISLMPVGAAMGISILSPTAALDPDVVVRQISSTAFS